MASESVDAISAGLAEVDGVGSALVDGSSSASGSGDAPSAGKAEVDGAGSSLVNVSSSGASSSKEQVNGEGIRTCNADSSFFGTDNDRPDDAGSGPSEVDWDAAGAESALASLAAISAFSLVDADDGT